MTHALNHTLVFNDTIDAKKYGAIHHSNISGNNGHGFIGEEYFSRGSTKRAGSMLNTKNRMSFGEYGISRRNLSQQGFSNSKSRLHPLYSTKAQFIDYNKSFYHLAISLENEQPEISPSGYTTLERSIWNQFIELIPTELLIPIDMQIKNWEHQDSNEALNERNNIETLHEKEDNIASTDESKVEVGSKLACNDEGITKRNNPIQITSMQSNTILDSLVHSILMTRLPFLRFEDSILWNMAKELRKAFHYVNHQISSIQFLSSLTKTNYGKSEVHPCFSYCNCKNTKKISPIALIKDSILIKCVDIEKYPIFFTRKKSYCTFCNESSLQASKSSKHESKIDNLIAVTSNSTFQVPKWRLEASRTHNILFIDGAQQNKTLDKIKVYNEKSIQARIKALQQLKSSTHEKISDILRWILQLSTIDVIVSSDQFIHSPQVDKILMENGIFCISGLTKRIYNKLRISLKGISVPSINYAMDIFPDGFSEDSEFTMKKWNPCGKCEHVSISQVGDGYYFQFKLIEKRKSLTLVVSSEHSKESKDLIMRAVDIAFNCLNIANKDRCVLPGGGVFEMMLSSYIRKVLCSPNSNSHCRFSSTEQSLLLALSRSLESIPKAIMDSYEQPVLETIAMWREVVDVQVEKLINHQPFQYLMPDYSNIRNNLQFVNIFEQCPTTQIYDLHSVKINVYQGAIKLVQKLQQIGHVLTFRSSSETMGNNPEAFGRGYEENMGKAHHTSIADIYHRHSTRFPRNQQWIQHAKSLEIKSQR